MPAKKRAKRKTSISPFSIIKKTSVTSLIAFLLFFLFKIIEPQVTTPQSASLPAAQQPVQLYSNQTHDDLTALYVQVIQDAKKSIHFVIYALMDPQIIRALNKKCGEGIPVHIVCDAKASPGISSKLPQATMVRRAGKGLTHQKILVVDQKQVWIGSANMTTDSLKVHSNLVIGMDHPALAETLSNKIIAMNEAGNATPLLHQKTKAGEQDVELWVLPDDPEADEKIISLLKAAQKTIQVAMFTWTRHDFTKELIAAARRGVKVEAVIDRYQGNGVGSKIVKMLQQGGIKVRLSTNKGLLHHKFVYIDEETLVNGSANWTLAAFNVNDDCFLVISPLTQPQQEKMNLLWSAILKDSEVAK